MNAVKQGTIIHKAIEKATARVNKMNDRLCNRNTFLNHKNYELRERVRNLEHALKQVRKAWDSWDGSVDRIRLADAVTQACSLLD